MGIKVGIYYNLSIPSAPPPYKYSFCRQTLKNYFLRNRKKCLLTGGTLAQRGLLGTWSLSAEYYITITLNTVLSQRLATSPLIPYIFMLYFFSPALSALRIQHTKHTSIPWVWVGS